MFTNNYLDFQTNWSVGSKRVMKRRERMNNKLPHRKNKFKTSKMKFNIPRIKFDMR